MRPTSSRRVVEIGALALGLALSASSAGESGGGGEGCLGSSESDSSSCIGPVSFDWEPAEPPPAPACGDDEIQRGEFCDGDDLAGHSCVSLGFEPGILACRSNCRDFDRSRCGAPEGCGDGERVSPEICDEDDLGVATCEILGLGAGFLACETNCADFDRSGCGPPPECGDGEVDGPVELCDGHDFGGVTCESFDLPEGELRCVDLCQRIDTSGCLGLADGDTTRADAGADEAGAEDAGSADADDEDGGGSCGALSYQGECDGELLRFCLDGETVEADCGELYGAGATCGLRDCLESDCLGHACVATSGEDCTVLGCDVGQELGCWDGRCLPSTSCVPSVDLPSCDGTSLVICRWMLDGVDCAGGSDPELTTCGVSAVGETTCVGLSGARCLDASDCADGLTCAEQRCVPLSVDAGTDDAS